MVPYGDNNSDDDSPSKYDYCCPTNNPDFILFHSLMFIAYSGCDRKKLAYHTCKHEQKVFNNVIMAINNNLSQYF